MNDKLLKEVLDKVVDELEKILSKYEFATIEIIFTEMKNFIKSKTEFSVIDIFVVYYMCETIRVMHNKVSIPNNFVTSLKTVMELNGKEFNLKMLIEYLCEHNVNYLTRVNLIEMWVSNYITPEVPIEISVKLIKTLNRVATEGIEVANDNFFSDRCPLEHKQDD